MWLLIMVNTLNLFLLNTLHPKISMHILHTVLYTLPKVLKKYSFFN